MTLYFFVKTIQHVSIYLLCFFKGFQGLAAYRSSNILWKDEDIHGSVFKIVHQVFGVDIHHATIDGR